MKKRTMAITAAAALCLGQASALDGCCGSIFGTADYLFWGAEQSGMTWAIAVNDLETFPSSRIQDELGQKFDWSSGFRLGLGYESACKGYDAALYWTRFHHRTKAVRTAPIIIATELLGLADFVVGGTGFGGPGTSQWKLAFDMVDFNLGYWLCHCRFFFHPYIGVKGGWIDQSQEIGYHQFQNLSSLTFLDSRVTEVNNFRGVGPKFGFDLAYCVGCGFSILGDMATSLLYGRLNSPTTTEVALDVAPQISGTRVFNYHAHKLVPAMQMLVGFNWETCWCRCWSLAVGVAYEAQYFWNVWRDQNSLIQNVYITDAGHGDLMFQGLTVRFKLTI